MNVMFIALLQLLDSYIDHSTADIIISDDTKIHVDLLKSQNILRYA